MSRYCSALLSTALACIVPATASAQETIDFGYDAKGRVTSVVRSGGPAGGTNTAYSYDRADNRASVTVTGASGSPGANPDGSATTNLTPLVIVVPLNGFTVITIPR